MVAPYPCDASSKIHTSMCQVGDGISANMMRLFLEASVLRVGSTYSFEATLTRFPYGQRRLCLSTGSIVTHLMKLVGQGCCHELREPSQKRHKTLTQLSRDNYPHDNLVAANPMHPRAAHFAYESRPGALTWQTPVAKPWLDTNIVTTCPSPNNMACLRLHDNDELGTNFP